MIFIPSIVLIMRVRGIRKISQLQFMLGNWWPDVLTQFSTFSDCSVSRNLFSKVETSQFGATRTEGLKCWIKLDIINPHLEPWPNVISIDPPCDKIGRFPVFVFVNKPVKRFFYQVVCFWDIEVCLQIIDQILRKNCLVWILTLSLQVSQKGAFQICSRNER